MRITVCDPSRKVNDLSKVICNRKIIAEFTRFISPTRIGKPALMMDIKVCKEIESKTVHKAEEGDR